MELALSQGFLKNFFDLWSSNPSWNSRGWVECWI